MGAVTFLGSWVSATSAAGSGGGRRDGLVELLGRDEEALVGFLAGIDAVEADAFG